MRPILIVGPPRSGTTWVGEILGSVGGVHRLHEPDNPVFIRNLPALAGKTRYPVLDADDDDPAYESIWKRTFDRSAHPQDTTVARVGDALLRRFGRGLVADVLVEPDTPARRRFLRALDAVIPEPPEGPAAERLLVKSVNSGFALPFVLARWDVDVIEIRRNPLNAVASWTELGWAARRPPSYDRVQERVFGRRDAIPLRSDDATETAAWVYLLLAAAIRQQGEHHPRWTVVQHEDLCADPVGGFRRLSDAVGLPWTEAAQQSIEDADRPGTGLEARRVAADQIDRWRTRLSVHQVEVIERMVAAFDAAAAMR